MKVLEIFGEPISNGGQESFVINIIKHIDHSNMDIDLLTPYYCDNEYYKNIVEDLGGKIYTFDLKFTPGKNRFNLNKRIDSFLKIHHYDIIHIHSGSISVLCIMAFYAKKHGVKKIIVHSHCAAEKKNFKYRMVRLFSYPFIKLFPTVYCACSQVAGEWKYPRSVVNKMIILKNGVDLNDFSYNHSTRTDIRLKLNIPDDSFVIGHVGRFSYQKNHEFLIDIFEKVLEINSNAVLMLIGDGENKKEIELKIKELGIASKVRLCGLVNNVNDYMQAMDVFVLPSRYEGLPIVGVEAQASGLPVITSNNVSLELKITNDVQFLNLKAIKISSKCQFQMVKLIYVLCPRKLDHLLTLSQLFLMKVKI